MALALGAHAALALGAHMALALEAHVALALGAHVALSAAYNGPFGYIRSLPGPWMLPPPSLSFSAVEMLNRIISNCALAAAYSSRSSGDPR